VGGIANEKKENGVGREESFRERRSTQMNQWSLIERLSARVVLMGIRCLLDTNIASCVIKGNSPAVDRRLVKVAMAQLAISAVTEGELRFGAARLPHATGLHSMIEEFLLRVAVLPWDSGAAQQYGQLAIQEKASMLTR